MLVSDVLEKSVFFLPSKCSVKIPAPSLATQETPMTAPGLTRRRFAALTGGALMAPARAARAQTPAPRPWLADMHSHYGMFRPRLGGFDLRQHMSDTGTTLLAWAATDDGRWTTSTPQGIKQTRQPQPGELWEAFQKRFAGYDAKLREWGLPKALTPADVDAALAGQPHVLMATEAANFLEGQPARVAIAHGWGVRHLQMVHFIDSPLGDHQTSAPIINGISPAGLQVIAECKRLGMVVDLAHGTPALVDAALDASDATMVWSHSWISARGGTWQDPANVARALSPAQARKIAAHGGLVGLWTVRVRDRSYPVHDAASFADEVMRMCDLLGPEHVAFGTDMEGAGNNPILSDYQDLREVADNLGRRGLPDAVLQGICIGNYARTVKRAMNGAA